MEVPHLVTLRAFLLSVVMHLAIGLLLISGLQLSPKRPTPSVSKTNIINAVSIDQRQVTQEIQRLKKIEQEKNDEEVRRKKALQKKADQIEQGRIAAKKQLKELQRQTQALQKTRSIEEKKARELQKRRSIEEKRIKALQKTRSIEEKKAREAEQQRARIEAEKRQAEEARKKRIEKEKRQKQAAKKRAQQEQAMQREIATEQQQHDQKIVEKYELLIRDRITSNFNKLGLPEDLSCVMLIRIIPSGDVVEVTIATPSGNALFDKRAESAVYAASPLPIPDRQHLFEKVRNIKITFKP